MARMHSLYAMKQFSLTRVERGNRDGGCAEVGESSSKPLEDQFITAVVDPDPGVDEDGPAHWGQRYGVLPPFAEPVSRIVFLCVLHISALYRPIAVVSHSTVCEQLRPAESSARLCRLSLGARCTPRCSSRESSRKVPNWVGSRRGSSCVGGAPGVGGWLDVGFAMPI